MVRVLTMSGSWYNMLLHGWYSEGVSSTDDTQHLQFHSMKSFRRQHVGQSIYLIARFHRQFQHFPPQQGGPNLDVSFSEKKTGSSSNSSCKDTRWSYLVAALQDMVGSRCVRNLKKTLGRNRDH